MQTRARQAAFLLGLAAAPALAGCGDDGNSVGDADVTTVTDGGDDEGGGDSGAETTTTASTSGMQVELLDPGGEPRQELRLVLDEGSEQRITMRQVQEQTVSGGGQEQVSRSATEIDVLYTVESVEDGVATVGILYEDARLVEADPSTEATMREVIEAFVGIEGTIRIDERGTISDAELDAPEFEGDLAPLSTMLDSLEGQLQNLSSPFPEEPIGVGGRWQVLNQVDLAGLSTTGTTTLTLTSVDGDATTADAEVTLDFSDFQGLEIVSNDVGGTATMTWSTGSIIPESTQVIDGTTVIRGPDGTEITLVQHQEVSTVRR